MGRVAVVAASRVERGNAASIDDENVTVVLVEGDCDAEEVDDDFVVAAAAVLIGVAAVAEEQRAMAVVLVLGADEYTVEAEKQTRRMCEWRFVLIGWVGRRMWGE